VRELAPDMDVNERSLLNLKLAAQKLRDLGHTSVRLHNVERLLKGLSCLMMRVALSLWEPLPATPFMAGSGGGRIERVLVAADRF
jgi:hypothetical protein